MPNPESIAAAPAANLDRLSDRLGRPADFVTGLYGPDNQAGIAYYRGLVDRREIENGLIQPLITLLSQGKSSLTELLPLLPEQDPRPCADLERAAADLGEGRTVLFLAGHNAAVSFDASGWIKHQPQEPKSERVIRGPREGFTETLDDNIGMVRRWVKDPRLRADPLAIGRRTRTRLAVLYLSDVAQPALVQEVHRRLTAIDIDGVIESGYLEQLIKDRRMSIYPLTQSTERTDKVAAAVLEGRVAILVDKSPFAVIVPTTINELYQSTEDYYFDFWLGSFLRLIRLLGNNLAAALPGLYVALVAVNPELLPTQFALAVAGARARIPVPLVAEVFILEIVVETFREAGLRIPGTIGQTLGIVAGVVLGLVGIQSGMVSPTTMVVVTVTAIASFTGPSYTVGITWRLIKYILLFGAGTFGLFGLTIAGMIILGLAADLKSFGVSYLAPWGPLQWPELADGPVRAPLWVRWQRPKTYKAQDRLRQAGTRREDDERD